MVTHMKDIIEMGKGMGKGFIIILMLSLDGLMKGNGRIMRRMGKAQ